MKSEEGDASTRSETVRQCSEKFLKSSQLVVDSDAKSLEDSLNGILQIFRHGSSCLIESRSDQFHQILSRPERCAAMSAQNRFRQKLGMRFVGVFRQKSTQSFLRLSGEHFGGAKAALGVHPHIERPLGFETEASIGIIDLHGRDAEIGEEQIGTLGRLGCDERGNAGKIQATGDE